MNKKKDKMISMKIKQNYKCAFNPIPEIDAKKKSEIKNTLQKISQFSKSKLEDILQSPKYKEEIKKATAPYVCNPNRDVGKLRIG